MEHDTITILFLPIPRANKEAVAASGAQILIDTGERKEGIGEDLDALQEEVRQLNEQRETLRKEAEAEAEIK